MKISNKSKLKTTEILYLFAYAICCFISLSGSSRLININDDIKIVLYLISFFIFLRIIILMNYTEKQFIVFAILLILSIYSYFKLNTIFIVVDVLAIFAIKNQNIKNIVKIDLIIKLIFIISHSILYAINYSFNYANIENYIITTASGSIRHAMYLIHPNSFSAIILWIIIDIYFLKNKLSIRDLLIMIVAIAITFLFTKTRTLLVIYFLFIILCILKEKNKFSNIFNYIYKYIFEIFIALTLILSFLYYIKIPFATDFLNSITSGRIGNIHFALKNGGLTLLPSSKLLGLNVVFDNFYIRLLTIYGIVFLIPLIMLTKRGPKEFNKTKLLVILLGIVLLSEYNGIIIGNCIILFLLAYQYFNSINEKNVKTKVNKTKKLKD